MHNPVHHQVRNRSADSDDFLWRVPAQETRPIIERRVATMPVSVERRSPRSTAQPSPAADRSRPRSTLGVLLLADAVAVTLTAAVSGLLSAVLISVVTVLVWRSAGLYSRRFTLSLLDDVPALSVGVACGTALPALLSWGVPSGSLLAAAVLLSGAMVSRGLGYAWIRRQRRDSRDGYPAVMLGSGPMATTLAERIESHPETGLRLVGLVDETRPTTNRQVPYLGRPRDLGRIVSDHMVREVIVCDGELPSAELVEVLRASSRLPVQIHVVPPLLQTHRMLAATDQVWGVPLERLRRHTPHGLGRRAKRLMDVVLSGTALLLVSPVLAVVALAVRYELGPGVLFRQVRVGLDGHHFELYKLRSMPHPGSDRERPWSARDDDLVGAVGRFIRRYSLDEIPQLFNVLLGDMSLVGPRPERPVFVEQFSNEVAGYGHRHRFPVGLTGLAAVEGLRGDTSIQDRAYFDNWYIENWSLWLDLKVLFRTVQAVVRGTGG